MPSVEFQEEQEMDLGPHKKKRTASRMAGWLIKKGFAKDEYQANSTMIIAAVVFLFMALIAIIL